MAQVTARVSDELEAALGRWAAEEGCQRSDLVRNLLAEAVDAHKAGRAMFDHPQPLDPAEIRRLVTDVRTLATEIDRVLRQNAKRDAELARQARADAVGVSDARAAIVNDLTTEMRRTVASLAGKLTVQPAEVIAALVASPAMAGITASLTRLEEQPGLKEICTYQQAQTVAIRTVNANVEKARQEPRVQNIYTAFGKDWSARMATTGSALIAAVGVVLFLGLAMVLPPSWLALRTANQLLGGGDQAICALVEYRMAVDGCRTQVAGRSVGVIVTTAKPKAR